MKNDNNIAIATRFQNKKSLDGGNFRHNQIVELVSNRGFEVIPPPDQSHRLGRLALVVRGALGLFMLFIKHFRFSVRHVQPQFFVNMIQLLVCGQNYYLWARFLRKECVETLVWEYGFNGGQGVLAAALECKCRIIAMPHNIDSLCRPSWNNYRQGLALSSEIMMLQKCDRVFAISDNDSWLHHQFGIESDVLSYCPAEQRKNDLLEIRELRATQNRQIGKSFLIIGACSNEATRLGMLELLKNITLIRWPEDILFEIAGSKTEELSSLEWPKNLFRFNGRVDDDAMRRMLIETDALLVYQQRGSGALTRILESLISGIPVIANRIAARDWENLSGVHIFDGWQDFESIVAGEVCQDVPIPSGRTGQVTAFVDSLMID